MAGCLHLTIVRGKPRLINPHVTDASRNYHAYVYASLTLIVCIAAFDEGSYSDNPTKAAEEVVYTLSMLDNVHPPVSPEENPLRHTLQSCWMQFKKRASPALQYRWKRHLTLYCIGVLQQVGVQNRASKPTVEEYMDMRANCVGAYPCIGLME